VARLKLPQHPPRDNLDAGLTPGKNSNEVMLVAKKKVKKLKLKTHRGAAKRFKITSTGKILRMHSGKRHLLGTKRSNRMRRLKKLKLVHHADAKNVHMMLPYG
jgi:large subunit ribosomal protein L35